MEPFIEPMALLAGALAKVLFKGKGAKGVDVAIPHTTNGVMVAVYLTVLSHRVGLRMGHAEIDENSGWFTLEFREVKQDAQPSSV